MRSHVRNPEPRKGLLELKLRWRMVQAEQQGPLKVQLLPGRDLPPPPREDRKPHHLRGREILRNRCKSSVLLFSSQRTPCGNRGRSGCRKPWRNSSSLREIRVNLGGCGIRVLIRGMKYRRSRSLRGQQLGIMAKHRIRNRAA